MKGLTRLIQKIFTILIWKIGGDRLEIWDSQVDLGSYIDHSFWVLQKSSGMSGFSGGRGLGLGFGEF